MTKTTKELLAEIRENGGWDDNYYHIIETLLRVIEMQEKCLKHHIDEFELVDHEYIGEYPSGGHTPVLIEWTEATNVCAQVSSELEKLTKEIE